MCENGATHVPSGVERDEFATVLLGGINSITSTIGSDHVLVYLGMGPDYSRGYNHPHPACGARWTTHLGGRPVQMGKCSGRLTHAYALTRQMAHTLLHEWPHVPERMTIDQALAEYIPNEKALIGRNFVSSLNWGMMRQAPPDNLSITHKMTATLTVSATFAGGIGNTFFQWASLLGFARALDNATVLLNRNEIWIRQQGGADVKNLISRLGWNRVAVIMDTMPAMCRLRVLESISGPGVRRCGPGCLTASSLANALGEVRQHRWGSGCNRRHVQLVGYWQDYVCNYI